ncbi:hypothetical protein HYX06_00660 [Candidatus Woesearchaeota archaeon]|nr:hypothetical protein [Candidatus Woesearchaeota archaeon]
MKHTVKITIALALFFFLAQLAGLVIVSQYIDHKKTIETQAVVLKDLPYGLERPQVQNQSTSFIYIAMAILIGTLFLLFIIKTNITFLWKAIFFFSVTLTLSIAFAAFINPVIAGLLALAISFWRLYRPNPIVHNISEIFIYGGLAAFMVNIFNLFAAFMLLILISAYDYIAVYRTKHMVKLAEFQSKSKVFAGLFIPYQREKIMDNSFKGTGHKKNTPKKMPKGSVAVLGGGDIGFTLIFAGVVMKGLMLHEAFFSAFLKTLIIPVFATFALLFLLIRGQHDKFYPAMPILSLGCFIGYLIVWLL